MKNKYKKIQHTAPQYMNRVVVFLKSKIQVERKSGPHYTFEVFGTAKPTEHYASKYTDRAES